jgi:hypothetical protein
MGPIATGLLMGIAGTAAMDVLAFAQARTGVAPAPNWAMPGRWAAHAARGRVFHDDIATAAPVAGELPLGWAFHYAVGIVYGVVFALLAGPGWLAAPSFLPVWLFALATIAAGWFLLQPGMGLGWAGARTEAPWTGRASGLLAHTAFGLGMWAAAVAAA